MITQYRYVLHSHVTNARKIQNMQLWKERILVGHLSLTSLWNYSFYSCTEWSVYTEIKDVPESIRQKWTTAMSLLLRRINMVHTKFQVQLCGWQSEDYAQQPQNSVHRKLWTVFMHAKCTFKVLPAMNTCIRWQHLQAGQTWVHLKNIRKIRIICDSPIHLKGRIAQFDSINYWNEHLNNRTCPFPSLSDKLTNPP